MKRKKRLEKGIESLEKQIKIHEKKKEIAKTMNNENLVKYYEKEIDSLTERRDDRKTKL